MKGRIIFRQLTLFFVFILLALTASVRADIVYLKNGSTLDGTVIKADSEFVIIAMTHGRITVPRNSVLDIEYELSIDTAIRSAKRHLRHKRYDSAVSDFRALLEVDKKSAEAKKGLTNALENIASHWIDLGRLKDAINALDEAKSLGGDVDTALARINDIQKSVAERLAQANVAVEAGLFSRAIVLFEEARELSQDISGVVDLPLASAYVGRADQLFVLQKFGSAKKWYDKAITTDPASADKFAARWVRASVAGVLVYIEQGRWLDARKDLQPILEFAPYDAQALFVNGYLYERQGNLKEAANNYARGLGKFQVGASDALGIKTLRENLKKRLARDMQIIFEHRSWSETTSTSWQQIQTPHFVLHHKTNGRDREIIAALEFHYERISRIIYNTTTPSIKGRVMVYIHATKADYVKETGSATWTGGVTRTRNSGGEVVQRIDTFQTVRNLLHSVLPHELAHVLINNKLKNSNKLPLLLHEGLAVYFEPAKTQTYYTRILKNRYKTETLIPVSELLNEGSYPSDETMFYASGSLLIQRLVKEKDFSSVIELCENITPKTAMPNILKYLGLTTKEQLNMWFKQSLK